MHRAYVNRALRSASRAVASNSSRSAPPPDGGANLVRVTHPFHPLSGQVLACVAKRYNRYGTRLLLRDDGDRVCSVPPRWTDLVEPDPEVVLANGRGSLLVGDLLELAEFVVVLKAAHGACKRNSVACVKKTTPRAGSKSRRT
jgi:hypothetical protein